MSYKLINTIYIENYHPNFATNDIIHSISNIISFRPHTEQLSKLRFHLVNTEAILLTTEIEKARLPNVRVQINDKA